MSFLLVCVPACLSTCLPVHLFIHSLLTRPPVLPSILCPPTALLPAALAILNNSETANTILPLGFLSGMHGCPRTSPWCPSSPQRPAPPRGHPSLHPLCCFISSGPRISMCQPATQP